MIRLNDINIAPMTIHGIGVGALLAICVGGYFLAIEPMRTEQQSRLALEQKLRVDGARLTSLRTTHESLLEKLEAGQTRLDETGVSLLPQSGRNTRLGDLTKLAGDCGLRLDSLQPGQAVEGEMFTITPITMRGVGSYSDVARFMHLSVQQIPDVSTRSFRLTAQDSGGQRLASFEFDLAWYADPADPAGD